MTQVEFCFDLSSPWTCLAFHNIAPIIERSGADIRWTPFLVGGVFNAVNQSVYEGRQDLDHPKMRFFFKSLKDWAAWSGVTINFPSPHHPVKSVHAMRFCCALQADQAALYKFMRSAFAAYFADQRNLDDPEILTAIAKEAGLDGDALLAQSQREAAKADLRANTQMVIDRGGFGSPTIFVGRGADDAHAKMFFGNDQLPLVERAIMQA
jgi:2-hydroxychromene-2-carboxylate isomerase